MPELVGQTWIFSTNKVKKPCLTGFMRRRRVRGLLVREIEYNPSSFNRNNDWLAAYAKDESLAVGHDAVAEAQARSVQSDYKSVLALVDARELWPSGKHGVEWRYSFHDVVSKNMTEQHATWLAERPELAVTLGKVRSQKNMQGCQLQSFLHSSEPVSLGVGTSAATPFMYHHRASVRLHLRMSANNTKALPGHEKLELAKLPLVLDRAAMNKGQFLQGTLKFQQPDA
ncbi:hypothetical protein X797_010992 [Metarhizium robertsii]|uniref:Uncharacterized protein n=1 Tax=Metarhizium robertsii TaxID=568076 RepID=A0A014P3E4_9HYPO|nr:hypothetical protein X797_010992 [Metarhizium robertsii]